MWGEGKERARGEYPHPSWLAQYSEWATWEAGRLLPEMTTVRIKV